MFFIGGLKSCSRKFGQFMIGTLKFVSITHVIVEHIGDFVICSGPSMEPTLYTNDAILTEHLSPRFNKISKGDIVVARSPTNPKQFICKRVTGVEGDKMCPGFISQVVVPRGHVWLEGDNRSNSSDSRAYGPVPIGLLRGRVLCVIWPFSHATLLTQPNT
ncbi:mitochondrial inner membrane protease subunit 1 [Macrosteles quadrilineatus]|uniref:mitochondrial inner membrane protease subunit 1 n=1 Tax=Macrosteles quadrilineatus TaxID=74068 RepID=UPI0023E21BE4|nr:mitochondrial inner membrane protease subunit 1 [Macrosteles quadrilineatus]